MHNKCWQYTNCHTSSIQCYQSYPEQVFILQRILHKIFFLTITYTKIIFIYIDLNHYWQLFVPLPLDSLSATTMQFAYIVCTLHNAVYKHSFG